MRLGGTRESSNVEDRRSFSGGKVAMSGGVAVVVVIVGLIMGRSPGEIIGDLAGGYADSSGSYAEGTPPPADDKSAQFVSRVLATTEDAWTAQLASRCGYTAPKLVLFRDAVQSACGSQSAAVGPFYCPNDSKAYLDLTFFDQMTRQLGAPGDFAQAYVVAHEIGHHVQNLLPEPSTRGMPDEGPTGVSVRVELQADCFAGVWGAYAKKQGILEGGDVEEAMRAAQAIGDDTLQKRGQGRVTPETFSHGTSAQRARWFQKGMDAGDMKVCDTFGTNSL